MTTLTDRILEKLNDRSMTLTELGAEMRLKPSEVAGNLRMTLEDLHRQKRLMIIGKQWTVTKRASPSGTDHGSLTAAEIEQIERHEPPAGPSPILSVLEEPIAPKPRDNPSFRITPESRDAAEKDRERILRLLAERILPMKVVAIHDALPDISLKTVGNRMDRLLARGQVEKTKAGYALPSATMADELDVKVVETPHGTIHIRKPTEEEIERASFDRDEVAAAQAAKDPNRFLDIGSMPLHPNELDQAGETAAELEPAPKFTQRPLAAVAVPAKFDKPHPKDLRVASSANGFIVSEPENFVTRVAPPPYVFNRFDDMVEYLRAVYLGEKVA